MSTSRKGKECIPMDTRVPTTSLTTTSDVVEDNCYLPEEIIVEILSRVPVNSILRFKCVCKSWLSLLSDPNFINLHYKRSSLDTKNHSFITRRRGRIRHFDFNPVETPVKYIMLPCRNFVLDVGGICKGLVLLSCSRLGNEMIIWNPATHMYKTIDVMKEEAVEGSSSSSEELLTRRTTLGFGLEVNEESFICLKIVSKRFVKFELGVEVEIFSTSTDSWRKLHVQVPFNMTESYNCVIVKGVPFWKAFTKGAEDNTFRNILISFDVKNEVFHQLEYPKTPHTSSSTQFTELNNSLAALVYYGWFQPVDIWMFDEKRGWSKNFSVGPILTEMGRLRCMRDRIVVENELIGNLFTIVTKLHEVKSIHLFDGNYCVVRAHKYCESLVSLDGMKEVQSVTWDVIKV